MVQPDKKRVSHALTIHSTNVDEREKEISRLRMLIETSQVSFTTFLVREEEEHVERLRRLINEANEADQRAQFTRTTIQNARANAEAKRHRLEATMSEISTLRSRIAMQEDLTAATPRADDRTDHTNFESSNADEHTSAEEVEQLESRVVALRKLHESSYTDLRQVKIELESLKANLPVLETQKAQLLDQELRLLATTNNECYDEARNLKRHHSDLLKQVEAAENELRTVSTEKQSMLRHLTDGALSRSTTIYELRKLWQSKAAPHEKDFLSQMLADNRRAREDAYEIFLSSDQELDALRQYESVLKQRVLELTKTVHNKNFQKELLTKACLQQAKSMAK